MSRLLLVLLLASVGARAADTLAPELAPPPYPAANASRGRPPHSEKGPRNSAPSDYQLWVNALSKEQRTAWFAKIGQHDPRQRLRLDETALPDVNAGYDWQATARMAGLGADETSRLGRDKLLIEDVQLRQIFDAYTGGSHPFFITTDSLLNGFHVLFEDSFRELEIRRAAALRRNLESILAGVRQQMANADPQWPASDLAPGWRQAQYVVGPALRLLGSSLDIFDADARGEIESQVAKIRRAEAVELPPWLGPPVPTLPAIDYRRGKPVGFYTGTGRLQNYFRAVRWLQIVPFRADHDDELTAIGLLGDGLSADFRSGAEYFFRSYDAFFGATSSPSLDQASSELHNFLSPDRRDPRWSDSLKSKRRWLLRNSAGPEGFKKLVETRRLPADAAERLAEIQFHVLSSHLLPDAVLLEKMFTDTRLPGGLDVAILLGSEFARRHLPAISPAQFDEALTLAKAALDPAGESPHSGNLYRDYLHALAAISAPAEPDAPDFMRGEAWAAKSCQTILGGWSLMRHTFTLQTQEAVNYLGLTLTPPGFVEPSPEFFRRMADLVERAEILFAQGDTFQPSPEIIADDLRADADFVEALGLHLPAAKPGDEEKHPRDTHERYDSLRERLADDDEVLPGRKDSLPAHPNPTEFTAYHRELIAALRREADRYASGERQPKSGESIVRQRWDALKSISRRLEALAHKQLRRQPWTKEEAEFIKSYGEKLALVMGYLGNSWLTPEDDAPRWVSVANDPRKDILLAVGVGRPRIIHVLYPWQGTEILCQGAVLSYREYPARTRLTDEEWKLLLDSKGAPPAPDWIAPYIAK